MAGAITPVPGGVGPLTIAMLMANTVKAAKMRRGRACPPGLRSTPAVLKVGLTGGIAAGKSVVGEMFAALGAHVVQADQISHQLMQPGKAVYQEVVDHFGAGILDPDGSVNGPGWRNWPSAAPAAFARAGTESDVHPAVIRRQEEWMAEVGRRDPHAIAMVEAALILSENGKGGFDRLVVVTCRPEQRIERWAQRLKVDLEGARREVTRRMAAQLSDEEKIKAADYVIDNSGPLEATEAQVEADLR